jgi:hypothetical protein
MMKKSLKKLINLSIDDFYELHQLGQIQYQEARLIPLLKTGDEGALTSIFLSSLKLVKEFKDDIFKEIKLSRIGYSLYLTEVVFHDIDDASRIDGLILVVSKNTIKDAVVFEMKNKNNSLDKEQINRYIGLSKKIGIDKMVTISNEFVSDSSQSPVQIKPPKNFSLYHFSWTYLMTKGQLLLFKNDQNIEDEDQVEIMKEVLHYLEAPTSGVTGYHSMKPGWKTTIEKIGNRIPLKLSDPDLLEAVESWHEEEKDMALLLSRKLGVLVKSTNRDKDSIKSSSKKLINEGYLSGNLSIKNSVSDIKIGLDFEIKSVSMSVKVSPPMDKGTKARITWLYKQLDAAKRKNPTVFERIERDLIIEANVKHARQHTKVSWQELDTLFEEVNGKEIQAFNIVYVNKFGKAFSSNKKFIVTIENMILEYYAGIVQYLTNWNRPAPKL